MTVAVIFEVRMKQNKQADYLDTAAALRPLLEREDGFLSIERFQSLSDPDKLLSLSLWRDEAAVAAWRAREQHRAAQARGRREIFADYRLRVAQVLRDYGMFDRAQAPADSRQIDDARAD
jgi:heme-degrading monooxygenase HmoA